MQRHKQGAANGYRPDNSSNCFSHITISMGFAWSLLIVLLVGAVLSWSSGQQRAELQREFDELKLQAGELIWITSEVDATSTENHDLESPTLDGR